MILRASPQLENQQSKMHTFVCAVMLCLELFVRSLYIPLWNEIERTTPKFIRARHNKIKNNPEQDLGTRHIVIPNICNDCNKLFSAVKG